MKLKFKSTDLDIKLENTSNNEGLKEEDNWCLINILIENSEFSCNESKEFLSKNEIINTIAKLKQYYYENSLDNYEIDYIKNYVKVIFKPIVDSKKIVCLKLITSIEENAYEVYLEDNEILEFINLLESYNI